MTSSELLQGLVGDWMKNVVDVTAHGRSKATIILICHFISFYLKFQPVNLCHSLTTPWTFASVPSTTVLVLRNDQYGGALVVIKSQLH